MSATVVAVELPGSRLDRVVGLCLNAGQSHVLALTGLIIGAVALADWAVGLDISLGFLYILPMVLAAIVLAPRSIVGLAIVCALLRAMFDNPHSTIEITLRFAFAALAYSSAGLFVNALIRGRQEQALRIRAEEQLKTLIESSPAGILTLDDRGIVLAANKAVHTVFGLEQHRTLIGRSIETYLPVLADALRLDTGSEPFRTSAQSLGRRENGGMFLADTWFSTYATVDGRRLAAIVIDSSEEMRDREEQGLRQLSMYSRIMAGAVLHEVRNLCSAISAVCSNLAGRPVSGQSEELQGLGRMVNGLARIASLELQPREADELEAVSLKDVLNDLRIIVEPSWVEIDGSVRWELPDEMPRVLADRNGLLQVFLNLAQNSQHAVQDTPVKDLTVNVATSGDRAVIRFQDTGCGIPDPQKLFQPFQPGADRTGLGLYISRSLLRSYGGELRLEPRQRGACFSVELLCVGLKAT